MGSSELGGASIYILLCSDGSYTFTRRPVKLVFSEHYERIVDAIAAERRIKGWSRAKKEAYMRGDFPTLVSLSKYYGITVTVASISLLLWSAGSSGSRRPAALRDILRHARDDDAGHRHSGFATGIRLTGK